MKKHLSIAVFAFSLLGMSACNEAGNGDTTNTDSSASDTNQSAHVDTSTSNPQPSAPLDSASVMFMTKAASGGMMEVQLGQIAQEQAQNQRVKDFGALMVRDHGKANDELKSLAAGKNTTVSDSLIPEHQHHVAELRKKKGAAFDKAYINMMVQDHKEDIKEFEKASNSLPDGELKAFATRILPVLKVHLDSATAVSKSKN